jgi:hypothetical protein
MFSTADLIAISVAYGLAAVIVVMAFVVERRSRRAWDDLTEAVRRELSDDQPS